LAGWFEKMLHLSEPDLVRLFRQFYTNAEAFKAESERLSGQARPGG